MTGWTNPSLYWLHENIKQQVWTRWSSFRRLKLDDGNPTQNIFELVPQLIYIHLDHPLWRINILVSPCKSFGLCNTHSIPDAESDERKSVGQKTEECGQMRSNNCHDCTPMRMLVPPGECAASWGLSPASHLAFMFPLGLSQAVAPDLNLLSLLKYCRTAKCKWRSKAGWSKDEPQEDGTKRRLQIVVSERYRLKKLILIQTKQFLTQSVSLCLHFCSQSGLVATLLNARWSLPALSVLFLTS